MASPFQGAMGSNFLFFDAIESKICARRNIWFGHEFVDEAGTFLMATYVPWSKIGLWLYWVMVINPWIPIYIPIVRNPWWWWWWWGWGGGGGGVWGWGWGRWRRRWDDHNLYIDTMFWPWHIWQLSFASLCEHYDLELCWCCFTI